MQWTQHGHKYKHNSSEKSEIPMTQAKAQAHGSENAHNTNIVSRTKGFVLVLVSASCYNLSSR